jgi:hypothetical protein
MTTNSSPGDTGIDATILDRMTDTLVILQAKSASIDRGRMIAALQAVRQLPADAQLLLVEGESDAHIVREYLLAIERTSLGTPDARRARTKATAGRVADILLRQRESVNAGPLDLHTPRPPTAQQPDAEFPAGGGGLEPEGRRSSAAAGSTGGSTSPGPFGRIARDQLGDFLDAAVDAAPVDSAAALRAAAAADVANQVADAITAALEAHGCSHGSWQSHLLCGALAAVAQAMTAGEDLARTAVIEGATAALAAGGVPRPAAALAGRAAADALMKLGPVRHYEDARRAVQMLAVTVCPNVADHPEVKRGCLQATASALLSSAIQEESAKSLPDGDRSPSAG